MDDTMIVVTIEADGAALIEENSCAVVRRTRVPESHRPGVALALLGGVTTDLIARVAAAISEGDGRLDRTATALAALKATFALDPDERID